VPRIQSTLSEIAYRRVATSKEWDEKFRMQGYVDQSVRSFDDLRAWIYEQFIQGPERWKRTFPLDLLKQPSTKALVNRKKPGAVRKKGKIKHR